MTAQLTRDDAPLASGQTPLLPRGVVVALVLFIGWIVVVAFNVQTDLHPRIADPGEVGVPRPIEPLFGFDHWIAVHQIGTLIGMIILTIVVVVGWRRTPGNPVLLMVIACTLLVWQDPISAWAPFAVYNPQLWHFPETWPLVSLSPSIEPFIGIGYAAFFLLPYFPAIRVLHRIQAKRPADSFVWRHPLLSLTGVIIPIAFVFDALLEIFLVRTQLYIFSHVVPFGSFATGQPHQFPLMWESLLVSLVMVPAGVLLYKDDTGKTQAEKLAQKVRLLRARPALGAFLVMFAVINVGYLAYSGSYWVMKVTKTATSVACPWPFEEAKVWDPQGFYEEQGQAGPFYPGIWAGWPTFQAGRPNVAVESDRCGR